MKALAHILKSQLGMTLAEITVAGGLMGAAALGAAAIMGALGDTTKDAEIVVAKTQFMSALGSYLNSGNGCSDMKVATGSGSYGTSATNTPMTLTKFKYEGKTSFSAGTEMKYFTIKSLGGRLEWSAGLPTVKMKCSDGVVRDLTKTYIRINSVITIKGRDVKQEFNVPVMVNASKGIEFCGEQNSDAETCVALNGTYDYATEKCKLKDTCGTYGSYTTLNCNPYYPDSGCDTSHGTATNNPITGTAGCPVGTTSVSTGGDTWNSTVSCGKKCTADVNNNLGFYTCLKCN